MPLDFNTLTAGQIMTKTLICAAPQQDLVDVERLLIEHRIGGVPVVDKGRMVGILSRSDIPRVEVLMNSLDQQVNDQLEWSDQADGFQHAHAAEFQGFRQMINRLKVHDAMHDQVTTCKESTPLRDVAELMVQQHIHRVVVVDGDRPVGIVSTLDLVRLIARPDSHRVEK